MVLYFSGTGNSQYVAVQIGEMIEDHEVVSINQCLKAKKNVTVRSERPLVFVAPVYCWRLPRVVEQWIMKTRFSGSQDAYFILTCGGDCGNAGSYAERLCEKKGLKFHGLAQVVMPENYLAMFPTPSEAECQQIVENAKPCISDLAEQIRSGQKFPCRPVSFKDKVKSGPINPLFYGFIVHDKGFSVSDRCVSCGKCVLRCPLNNIDLENGRPVWKGNCTHCMACIGGCPTEAIEYKNKSQGQHRHDIMKTS